jgi:hypothetical protein
LCCCAAAGQPHVAYPTSSKLEGCSDHQQVCWQGVLLLLRHDGTHAAAAESCVTILCCLADVVLISTNPCAHVLGPSGAANMRHAAHIRKQLSWTSRETHTFLPTTHTRTQTTHAAQTLTPAINLGAAGRHRVAFVNTHRLNHYSFHALGNSAQGLAETHGNQILLLSRTCCTPCGTGGSGPLQCRVCCSAANTHCGTTSDTEGRAACACAAGPYRSPASSCY